MASTNCKKKIAIVYTSVTGNTKAVADMLNELMPAEQFEVELWKIEEFPFVELSRCDALLIGTYTWGSGEIPKEMQTLYEAIENLGRKNLITAVFGTGDSFFAEFCGAVNRFRDMLYVHTTLAATLKIELAPELKDRERLDKLIECVLKKLGR